MPTIEDILRDHNIPYRIGGEHHHVRTGWIGVDCPYCGTQGKYHLGINKEGNFASCWKCGSHSLVDALAALLGTSRGKAHLLAGSVGWAPRALQREANRVLRIPKGLEELSRPHRLYLRRRGFDPDELTRVWGLKGLGIAGRYSWRIWIPVNYRGELASWTTRAIGELELRYLNASPNQEIVSLKKLLYGLDLARNTIIVCEGPTDVWRLGPGAVATFGMQYTQTQLALMARYARRYICFDNTPDAQARGRKLADQLSLLPGMTNQLILDAEDPGSAGPKEVSLIRRTVFGAE